MSDSFVYYKKDTGKIIKISNRKTHTDLGILQTAYENVKDLVTGVRRTDEFTVRYDLSLKQYRLVENNYEDEIKDDSKLMFEIDRTFTKTSVSNTNRSTIFKEIFDGVDVYMWIKEQQYYKDSIIYYKGNVYKLLKDNDHNEDLEDCNIELYIDQVYITTYSKIDQKVNKIKEFLPIYEGIHVDVWYQELTYLEGQHVWYENTVYICKEQINNDVVFDNSKFDIILENVKLYNDENIFLTFDEDIKLGDSILDMNLLYSVGEVDVDVDYSNLGQTIFYTNESDLLIFDDYNKTFSLSKVKSSTMNSPLLDTEIYDPEVVIVDIDSLQKGQKILVGKKLFLADPIDQHDYDLAIIQNKNKKSWEFFLNRTTRKRLSAGGYDGNMKFYFSITPRGDPNIIYRSLEIKLQDLINGYNLSRPFTSEWETGIEEVSIYTPKYFEKYNHEIII